MNKFTKEIANILEAQIDNKPYDLQQMWTYTGTN